MASQVIGIWLSVLYTARPMARKGMFEMGVLMLISACFAIALALACIWLVVGILGTYDNNSAGKAVLLLVFSTPCVFGLALFRASKPKNKFPGLISLMFYCLTVCGTYHAPQTAINRAPVHLLFYCSVAVAITWVVSSLVVPTPSGMQMWGIWGLNYRLVGWIPVS